MTGPFSASSDDLLAQGGPLSRAAALAALDRAAALMSTADYLEAAQLYQRVIGFDDPAVTAAAMLGFGQALHRLDDEPHAMGLWIEVTRLPETPATYLAWREIASARVRGGDNAGALAAYREAQRRAPAADRPEIQARLGWLSKELGDTRAAGRYFSRARGSVGAPTGPGLTLPVIAITVVVSLLADSGLGSTPTTGGLINLLALDKAAIAAGEIWRLWTVVLVHAPFAQNPFHLLLNMYSLWIVGPLAERLYGARGFLLAYLVTALGGSLATFAFSPDPAAVGASGAIFGLVGLLVGAHYVQRPLLDRATGAFMGQLVLLIVINLLFGFTTPGIDNTAHIGGLISGFWLGAVIPPTGAPTLRSLWLRPGPTAGTMVPALGAAGTRWARIAALVVLAGVFAVMWMIGVAAWSGVGN